MKLWIPCIVCGRKATWSYMPDSSNYCDSHVPKGCSCNDDTIEPCVEYHEILPEFHDDSDMVYEGWKMYYTDHPEERDEEYDVYEPEVHVRTRRTRIKDARTKGDARRFYENGHARGGNSKPRAFKPNRTIEKIEEL